jgi:hypothetical protein
MAKRKAKAVEVVEAVAEVKELDLKAMVSGCDRSVPFTFKRSDFSKPSVALVLFEAKSSTSKIEYHGNGDITLHWK